MVNTKIGRRSSYLIEPHAVSKGPWCMACMSIIGPRLRVFSVHILDLIMSMIRSVIMWTEGLKKRDFLQAVLI